LAKTDVFSVFRSLPKARQKKRLKAKKNKVIHNLFTTIFEALQNPQLVVIEESHSSLSYLFYSSLVIANVSISGIYTFLTFFNIIVK